METVSRETGVPQSPIYVSAEGLTIFSDYISAQIKELTEEYIARWKPPWRDSDHPRLQ